MAQPDATPCALDVSNTVCKGCARVAGRLAARCHTPKGRARSLLQLTFPLQARAAGVPLRVTGISPGLVETEFFTVRVLHKFNGQQLAAELAAR